MDEQGKVDKPAATERTGHALIGLASMGLALFIGLSVIGIIVLEIYLHAEHRTAKKAVTHTEIVVGILSFLGLLLGGALGAVGLIQKTKKRLLPVVGCAFNFMVFMLGIVALILVLTGKHRF